MGCIGFTFKLELQFKLTYVYSMYIILISGQIDNTAIFKISLKKELKVI